jgi:hypothetical protein
VGILKISYELLTFILRARVAYRAQVSFLQCNGQCVARKTSLVTPLGVTTYFRITVTHVATPKDVTKFEFLFNKLVSEL